MDFVVSKVAMSVCALLVISVLSGVFSNNSVLERSDELHSILRDLASVLEQSIWSGCEGYSTWRVPFLSDGGCIDISVGASFMKAETEEEDAMIKPASVPHTWTWNGTALNQSSIESLDATSEPAVTHSGLALEIRAKALTIENQYVILAFVRAST